MTPPEELAIEDVPSQVNEILKEYFDARRPAMAHMGAPVNEAVDYLEEFVLGGGKRIRPLYAWAGFTGAGGLTGEENPAAALRAAAALEFIQACALVHDDIIDASDSRRGSPTVHRKAEAHHRHRSWEGDAAAYGTSMAILVGDLALAWADDMLADAGLSPAAQQRVREPWRAMRAEVIGGQMLDISLEASGAESRELAESVNRFKTAAYTIERPLHIGAAIAGGSPELVEAFRAYGRDIGVAFQLRDDLLGVYGDPQVTGKPAGDDLREGKVTVLLITALEKLDSANPEAARELRRLIGASEDPSDITTMMDSIARSGAPEEIESRIDQLTESGIGRVRAAGIEASTVEVLENLARTATARRK